MLATRPHAPVMNRGEQRELNHDVRIFGVGVGVEIEVSIMPKPGLRRLGKISKRALGATYPVAKGCLRLVEPTVDRTEHVQELPGRLALTILAVRADRKDRVVQDDPFACGERLG